MKLVLTAVLVLTASTVRAQTDANPILDGAIAAFGRVSTLRADFTQTVRDEMIGTNATSRGEFLQQRPNKFAMRWRQPAGDVILADGSWLWVYLPSSAPNQVIRSAVSGQPGQTPDLVAEFLERPRERFTIAYLKADAIGGRPADALTFTPKRRDGPYQRVIIWVDRADSLPHQVEITEASGTVRRITFDRMRVNATLPASSFTFRPPPNARVVDASTNE